MVAVPYGVVTATSPEAPVPTNAVISVEEITVNEAATPPKLTEVVPVKLVPYIVIVEPCCPSVGVNDVIVGTGI